MVLLVQNSKEFVCLLDFVDKSLVIYTFLKEIYKLKGWRHCYYLIKNSLVEPYL